MKKTILSVTAAILALISISCRRDPAQVGAENDWAAVAAINTLWP